MEFLEKDLEDLIHEASQTDKGRSILFNRGLPVNRKLKRQFKIGKYGVIDLICSSYEPIPDKVSISIYELKKDRLKPKHLIQLCRYITGIKRFTQVSPPFFGSNVEVNGYLIGKDIYQESDFCFLCNQLDESIKLFDYEFDLQDGLIFNEISKEWKMTNDFGASNIDQLSTLYDGLYSPYNKEISICSRQLRNNFNILSKT
jgi:hypothetical protein